jgi:hypothetical protein
MAFTEFYMQTTGNDANAGSSSNNNADVTSTNGGWSTVTNIFTAAAGTPFSAVVANTDWASIYIDGATIAVFVGLVTTVGGGGASVTISATLRFGTAPTTNATTRSCKINGAWASPAPLTNGKAGVGTLAFSQRINTKAGTYSALTTVNWGINGTTTFPHWWRGYNTTPGDLDNDTTNSLAKPLFSFAANQNFTYTAAFGLMTGLSLVGNINGNLLANTSSTGRIMRCRFENQSSGANAVAATGGNNNVFAFCWFKCPTTANAVVTMVETTFIGCVAEGGIAGYAPSTRSPRFYQCTSMNALTNGFKYSTGSIFMANCTVSNCGGDGVAITGVTAGSSGYIMSCLFRTCGGWAINNSSGTNLTMTQIALNDYYNCSSGNVTGFGDSVTNFWEQTDSADPIVSSSNLSLVAGAHALNNGFPGIFENESYISYVDCGAVQGPHIGGSGPLVPPEVSSVFLGG